MTARPHALARQLGMPFLLGVVLLFVTPLLVLGQEGGNATDQVSYYREKVRLYKAAACSEVRNDDKVAKDVREADRHALTAC